MSERKAPADGWSWIVHGTRGLLSIIAAAIDDGLVPPSEVKAALRVIRDKLNELLDR